MKKYILIAVAAVLVLIVGNSCFFTLSEGECAIVQRFGKIQAMYVKEISPRLAEQLKEDEQYVSVHTGTGLKFKLPFIDNVIKYSSMLISYETQGREVITSDKRKLYFDNNAQWKVENPYRLYKSYKTINGAKHRIDDILYSRMNEKVGSILSHTIITDKDATAEMLNNLTQEVSDETFAFGISVIDIRIKRTDLPEENYASIYNRMNTERNRIAAQYRSEGDEEAIKIRSKTDQEVISITSSAFAQAEMIKGEGDSEAARIYNEAYSKNPDFFEFFNLLETYKTTLGSSSTIVIPLDSPFAKYLLGIPSGTQAVIGP